MGDLILRNRLDMLAEHLQTALRMTKHLGDVLEELGIDEHLRDQLRFNFEGHSQKQERKLRTALDALNNVGEGDHVAIQTAWSNYTDLSELNARIYREFLEAMLGLAIRRHQIDGRFCKMADALIASMKGFRVSGDALAIPASQEAYSRTLANLVRMRFPEFTIWSLPLVAHEFGHVVIEEVEGLEKFARDEVMAAAARDPEYVKDPADEPAKRKNRVIERRAFCRIRQLIADAFAVYAIGPSYACSLIYLRLGPVARELIEKAADDAERAAVVIEMLRLMADVVPKPSDYPLIIGDLEKQWNGMVARSGVKPLEEEVRQDLVKLTGRVRNVFADEMVPTPYKPTMPGGGWSKAYEWYSSWADTPNPKNLAVPENVNGASKVYDALNAAWAYRILFRNWESLEPVANAAWRLCEAMTKIREEAASQSGGGKAPGRT